MVLLPQTKKKNIPIFYSILGKESLFAWDNNQVYRLAKKYTDSKKKFQLQDQVVIEWSAGIQI